MTQQPLFYCQASEIQGYCRKLRSEDQETIENMLFRAAVIKSNLRQTCMVFCKHSVLINIGLTPRGGSMILPRSITTHAWLPRRGAALNSNTINFQTLIYLLSLHSSITLCLILLDQKRTLCKFGAIWRNRLIDRF